MWAPRCTRGAQPPPVTKFRTVGTVVVSSICKAVQTRVCPPPLWAHQPPLTVWPSNMTTSPQLSNLGGAYFGPQPGFSRPPPPPNPHPIPWGGGFYISYPQTPHQLLHTHIHTLQTSLQPIMMLLSVQYSRLAQGSLLISAPQEHMRVSGKVAEDTEKTAKMKYCTKWETTRALNRWHLVHALQPIHMARFV